MTEEMEHWICPMHDGGESDHAGKCPKCGMALVKGKATTEKKEQWACPMHAGEKSDHAGKCPKCGMALVLKKD
jgi:Cu+-exporting ATPase